MVFMYVINNIMNFSINENLQDDEINAMKHIYNILIG